MNIIYINNKHKYKIFSNIFFKELTNDMIHLLKYPYYVELNIIICNEQEIKELNMKYRKINKPTDVLSFPIDSNIEITKSCGFNMLGDIYICDSIIKKVAKLEKRTIQREYSYMYLHSLLHLMGYDHIIKKQEMEMHNYIEVILKNKGIIN